MNQNRILSRLFRAGILLLAGPSILAADLSLSLREAFERAPEVNLDVLIAREAVDGSQSAEKRSRANLLPQVSGSIQQGRSRSPFIGAFSNFPLDPYNNRFDALLSVQLSLFSAENWAEYEVAKFNTQIQKYALESTVQDVLQAIGESFFTHLRNLERMKVIEANLERDRVLLQIARDQYEAGVATPIDVTRAEVQLSNNELAQMQQETAVLQSELLLKRLLNLEYGGDLNLESEEISEQALDAVNSASMESALQVRSDYLAQTRTLERNRVARKAAFAQRIPTVDLSAQWGVATEVYDDAKQEQWQIGLGINIPIWEGGRIDANVREADSIVRQQEHVVEQLEDTIEADLRLAMHDVRSRFKQIAITKRTIDLNQRELELARTRFEEGVADNSDVVDAQARLAAAEDEYVESVFQYNLSRLSLARIRGDVKSAAY